MSDSKGQVRARARDFRNRLAVHPDMAEHAAQNFLNQFNPSVHTKIALYLSHGTEMDTYPLAELLWAMGCAVLLPVVHDDTRVMNFARWDKNSQLHKNKFGILEPHGCAAVLPDIVVVPLLAFDQSGIRLGQGGGYYDATLRHLRDNSTVIAVGYAYAAQAVLLALPREDHDEKLDFVVTEQRVFSF